jgi:hypothetical protein
MKKGDAVIARCAVTGETISGRVYYINGDMIDVTHDNTGDTYPYPAECVEPADNKYRSTSTETTPWLTESTA